MSDKETPTWQESLLRGSDLTRIALPSDLTEGPSASSGKLLITVTPTMLWKTDNGAFLPTEFTFNLQVANRASSDAVPSDANLVYTRKDETNGDSALWPVCEKARTALATLMLPTLEEVHRLSVEAEDARPPEDAKGTDFETEKQQFDALFESVLPLFKVYLETYLDLLLSHGGEDEGAHSERCTLKWVSEDGKSVQVITGLRSDADRDDIDEGDTTPTSAPTSPGRVARRFRSLLRSNTFPMKSTRRALSKFRKNPGDTHPSEADQRRERRRLLTKEIWAKARQAAGHPSLDLLQASLDSPMAS